MIEPLLPQRQRRFRHPGRKRLDDRPALQGILFVLHTGIAWKHLPQELGYGSGITCWRRLAEWNASGVWQRLDEVLLDRLRAADPLDFSRAACGDPPDMTRRFVDFQTVLQLDDVGDEEMLRDVRCRTNQCLDDMRVRLMRANDQRAIGLDGS